MLTWLSANFINIVLVAALALIVAAVLRGMLRRKKTGACACSCGCASCGGGCGCTKGPSLPHGGRGK